jgi:hypothetical protein
MYCDINIMDSLLYTLGFRQRLLKMGYSGQAIDFMLSNLPEETLREQLDNDGDLDGLYDLLSSDLYIAELKIVGVNDPQLHTASTSYLKALRDDYHKKYTLLKMAETMNVDVGNNPDMDQLERFLEARANQYGDSIYRHISVYQPFEKTEVPDLYYKGNAFSTSSMMDALSGM